jgi:hypothetical protein
VAPAINKLKINHEIKPSLFIFPQDTYGALQEQVRGSVAKQETLLSQIQEKNSEFTAEKMGGGCLAVQREDMLKDLAAGYDAFMDLQKHLQVMTKPVAG